MYIHALHRDYSVTGTVIQDSQLDDINELSSRAAMALPDYSLRSDMDDLSSVYAALRTMDKDRLLQNISDPNLPFAQRFVSGQILALTGDPRIDVYAPDMISIPATRVKIGLPADRVNEIVQRYRNYGVKAEWIEKETPEFSTLLNRYSLSRYCVTHHEYLQFLQDTQYSNMPRDWPFGVYPAHKANHPIHSIEAEDALAYIDWLNNKTGRQFRLPTEYEWEYAASGPEHLEFPWGNEFERDRCNTVESGILQSTPVGMFPKGIGPFGHYDLAGNVEEYVSDYYHAYPGNELIKDDLYRGEGYRVARGGSFTRFRDLARTRRRHGRYPSELYVMGFRLAESADAQEP